MAKGRPQQRGPVGPEFTIHLNCVPEKRPGGAPHAKAVVLVTHRSGNPPLPLPNGQPREVDFVVDDVSVGRKPLGPDGGARMIVKLLDGRSAYVFRVHLVGTPYWSNTMMYDTEAPPKEEEKPSAKPDKFEAQAVGGDGRYTISVMVADAENRPVKGALVEVYDEKHDPHLVFRGRTNKDGVLEDEPVVEFEESFRTFIVQSPGFKSERLTLTGPGRKAPPKTPEPTPEQLSGSIWDVIRNAARQARMDMQVASIKPVEQGAVVAAHLRLQEQFAEERGQPKFRSPAKKRALLGASCPEKEVVATATPDQEVKMLWFRRLVWRFAYAFTANNNVRLLTLWVVTAVWFTAHAFIFGIGQQPETELSEVAQRFNNYHLHRQWATNAELASFGDAVQSLWGSVSGAARWVSGKILLVLILASVIYFPIAMSDEVRRAWQTAARRVRERRGGLTDLPDTPTPSPAGGAGEKAEKPPTKMWHIFSQIVTGFVNEFWQLLAHRALGR